MKQIPSNITQHTKKSEDCGYTYLKKSSTEEKDIDLLRGGIKQNK